MLATSDADADAEDDDDDTGTVTDEQSVAMTASHETDNVTLMEAATPMPLNSHEEEEDDTQK